MQKYDRAFLDNVYQRFETLRPDAVPRWGHMRPPQLFAHLATAVRYGLRKEPLTPPEGGLLARFVVGPLLLNGIVPMPKNVKAPKMYDVQAPEATLDDFKAEAEEFLMEYKLGRLDPPPHPYFGDFGPKGWAKLHVIHFNHHMKQFGV